MTVPKETPTMLDPKEVAALFQLLHTLVAEVREETERLRGAFQAYDIPHVAAHARVLEKKAARIFAAIQGAPR